VGLPPPLKHERLYLTAVVKASGQEVEAIRLWDDGSHGDRNPRDGIYHNFFHTETFSPGTYELRIKAQLPNGREAYSQNIRLHLLLAVITVTPLKVRQHRCLIPGLLCRHRLAAVEGGNKAVDMGKLFPTEAGQVVLHIISTSPLSEKLGLRLTGNTALGMRPASALRLHPQHDEDEALRFGLRQQAPPGSGDVTLHFSVANPFARIQPMKILLRYRQASALDIWWHRWARWVLLAGVFVGVAIVSWRRHETEKKRKKAVKKRHDERSQLAGRLKVWGMGEEEPLGDGEDLSRLHSQKLVLVVTEQGGLKVSKSDEVQGGEVVARLFGCLVGASPNDAESGKPEFTIQPVGGHALAYESRGEMSEACEKLTLCDNDVLEIDGKWRLRYTNTALPTRAMIESAQTGGISYARQ